uniref:tRNA threonylcarbamoyladenosine biosynthesis protein TsaE n=1 Tax=Ammonifex degensii TaxID=42838 RepID=A0A7C1F817_9THEO
MLEVRTDSDEATRALGEKLGRLLNSGDLVALTGELGAGKTCFAQGLARGVGVKTPVNSPTFVLIKEYAGRLPLYHFDAYRLSGPEEFFALGSAEYFAGDGVSVVEWADRVVDALPEDRVEVTIQRLPDSEEGRLIRITGCGQRSRSVVEELKRDLLARD